MLLLLLLLWLRLLRQRPRRHWRKRRRGRRSSHWSGGRVQERVIQGVVVAVEFFLGRCGEQRSQRFGRCLKGKASGCWGGGCRGS
jgi:hypothetical protein